MVEPIPVAHPHAGREPTPDELAAEDERARQDLADADLPVAWLEDDD